MESETEPEKSQETAGLDEKIRDDKTSIYRCGNCNFETTDPPEFARHCRTHIIEERRLKPQVESETVDKSIDKKSEQILASVSAKGFNALATQIFEELCENQKQLLKAQEQLYAERLAQVENQKIPRTPDQNIELLVHRLSEAQKELRDAERKHYEETLKKPDNLDEAMGRMTDKFATLIDSKIKESIAQAVKNIEGKVAEIAYRIERETVEKKINEQPSGIQKEEAEIIRADATKAAKQERIKNFVGRAKGKMVEPEVYEDVLTALRGNRNDFTIEAVGDWLVQEEFASPESSKDTLYHNARSVIQHLIKEGHITELGRRGNRLYYKIRSESWIDPDERKTSEGQEAEHDAESR